MPKRAVATTDEATRSERVEFRLRGDEKALMQQAAEMGGEDVSSFVRRVALTDARRLLAGLRSG